MEEKIVFSTNGAGIAKYLHRRKWTSNFTLHTKITSKCILYLSIKSETIKCLEMCQRKLSVTLD